jgi:NifU-like protein involved in Fe-S cluster formation
MQDLYQEELMDIFKHPHNKGTIVDSSVGNRKWNCKERKV